MVNFNLTFQPDPTTGDIPDEEKRNALTVAVNTWGRVFDHDATLDLSIGSIPGGYFSPLMSARPSLIEDDYKPFGASMVARHKVLFGEDINGDEADGEIFVNWTESWALDIDTTPDRENNQFDFYSTIYHELTHILGFANVVDYFKENTGVNSNEEELKVISLSAFGQFVSDADGQKIFDSEGIATSEAYDDLGTGGSSAHNKGLFFNGENAVAANNGNPVGLYSPRWFRGGSSGSHLDDDNPALSGSLMLAYADSGQSARHLSKVERGILLDLGYSLRSPFSISEAGNGVEVTDWLGANAIALTFHGSDIDDVRELSIFSTDELGNNRQQIAGLSIVNDAGLSDHYAPSFTISRALVGDSRFLQFEISGASQSTAHLDSLKDGMLALNFGDGLQASLEISTHFPTQHLLSDNAATIDVSAQDWLSTFDFTIYRDAQLNSLLGFYQTDTTEGAIITDPLLGTALMPGDDGYKEAALSRYSGSMFAGENGEAMSHSDWIRGQDFTSMFLVVDNPAFDGTNFGDSTVYFSHAAANPNGNQHIKKLGNNTFGFEDSVGLGDHDYNDMVVQFSVSSL